MSRKTTIIGSIVILAVIVAAILIVTGKPGEKGTYAISRPWVNTHYRDLPDSTLLEKARQNDTLAAMVLGWHYMDYKEDTANAAIYLLGFNCTPETASADLNYLSARAFMATGRDSLAISCLLPIAGNKAYPNAAIYLANTYKKMKNYEQALATYQKINKKYLEGADDSALFCKGQMGDTASAMKFALKAVDEGQSSKGVPFFSKYVSLSRGVSPASWSYAAGMAFLDGNNPSRAAVYLENADAETTFAALSYNLGLAYYRLQVYDSSASKLTRAMELGDSSINLINALIGSYRNNGLPEKAYETSLLGIKVHPEFEEFYFIPARKYYEEKKYDSLLAFANMARRNVHDSYKMDSYYAAANYLVGNREITYALVDTLIMKYRFQGGALTESAKLFETSLGMEDAAQRMRQNDPNELYPELTGFFYFYNINKSRGMLDSCKQMLQDYMEKDTSNIHRQLLTELYNRDFNNSAEHKDP